MDKVLTVRFLDNQDAEDLFRCVENGRVYIRQPANVDDIVFWYSSVKWRGGYEASCHIRAGITMRVVDKDNEILFEEKLEEDNWNGGTSAKKVGRFSDEVLLDTSNEWAEKLRLRSYYDWKNYVLMDIANCGYQGYADNWLYYETESHGKEILGEMSWLGKKLFVVKEDMIHKISGKRWSCVFIEPKDESYCADICGYIF